jgi:hypothetical protein
VEKLASILFDDPHVMSCGIQLCDTVKKLRCLHRHPALAFHQVWKSAAVNTNVYVSIKTTITRLRFLSRWRTCQGKNGKREGR